MKRITLAVIGLAMAGVAVAQDPVPPTPPARPAIATPAPAPVARPMEPDWRPALAPLGFDMEEMRMARERAMENSRIDMESTRAAIEATRSTMEVNRAAIADARVDVERAFADARTSLADMRLFGATPSIPPMPALAPMAAFPAIGRPFASDLLDRRTPPPAWAQGDPADSLYSEARQVLNRGDWGRAARMFADLQKNYPKSAYQNESQYWEAWARYKIGTTDELRTAAKILEPLASRVTPQNTDGSNPRRYYSDNRRTSDSEILALYARINGALAQRGDRDAAAKVEKAAQQQGAPCDREDIQVRTEALNALSQMDPTQALPILRRVLDRKDECSAELRRNAVFILGRRSDADAQNILMSVAKSDPNITVRTEAINYLSRIPGDAGLAALEEMLRSEQDERIQRAAVHALMSSDSPRARSSMRTLIDRKDSPLNLRIEAINSFNSERATADDAAYLRGLFSKADNDQMKNAILSTLSRMGGAENDQFVLSVARNNNESSNVRSNALSRLSRSPTVSTADLMKLYDASSESAEIRNRIIGMLGARKDQEATDKLIEIVRTSTVVDNRTRAIVALRDKKDPRATQALMDILDGKKP
jgi:HEAT repeat protein/TolA-binding protein